MRVEDIDQQFLHPLEKKLDKHLQFIDPTKFRSNNHLVTEAVTVEDDPSEEFP